MAVVCCFFQHLDWMGTQTGALWRETARKGGLAQCGVLCRGVGVTGVQSYSCLLTLAKIWGWGGALSMWLAAVWGHLLQFPGPRALAPKEAAPSSPP